MGFHATQAQLDDFLSELRKTYHVYAPVRYEGGGAFSDTDSIRYGEIQSVSDVVFDEKSHYSSKEVVVPVSQTLFFFTEDHVKEADAPTRDSVIFMRSCDLHALKRLDDIYLENGPADSYYHGLRDGAKIVLMGCSESFDSCFCVSMGTNVADGYDLAINANADGTFDIDCKDPEWTKILEDMQLEKKDVAPAHVTENAVTVNVPDHLTADAAKSTVWDEYDGRCINCGRCSFVCPSCGCFTMQDIHYTDNGRVGERRRVWASCMVDGYTDVAGGGSYRRKNGQRMRFKVLHKVLDHKKRKGYHMCVGCGRCDDICPEYISFSHCVGKLGDAMEEVSAHDA